MSGSVYDGAVSGIMVDGVDVYDDVVDRDGLNPGDEVSRDRTLFCQVLDNADMICLSKYTATKESGEDEGKFVYAVYGNNKIVTAFIQKRFLANFIDNHKDRLVVVEKRPYILNGVAS